VPTAFPFIESEPFPFTPAESVTTLCSFYIHSACCNSQFSHHPQRFNFAPPNKELRIKQHLPLMARVEQRNTNPLNENLIANYVVICVKQW
jgi:hypothetical protein